MLLHLYLNQVVFVIWNGCKSNLFGVSNGVRQGSILSAHFFVIYIDNLLILLNNSKIGCNIFNIFINNLAYADDIILLSPSVYALQLLIDMCVEYASEHNIIFNSSKSECILFNYGRKCHNTPIVLLYDKPLCWKYTVKHLGHTLNFNLDDSLDIEQRSCDFISKSNMVLSTFHMSRFKTLTKTLLPLFKFNL